MANISLKALLNEARSDDETKYLKTLNKQRLKAGDYTPDKDVAAAKETNAPILKKLGEIGGKFEKDGWKVEPSKEYDARYVGLDFTKELSSGGELHFQILPTNDNKFTMGMSSRALSVKKAGGIKGLFGGKDSINVYKNAQQRVINAEDLDTNDLQQDIEDKLRGGLDDMKSQWVKENNLPKDFLNNLHDEAGKSLTRQSSIKTSNSSTKQSNGGTSANQPKAGQDPADTNRNAKLQQLAKLQQQKAQQDKQKVAGGGDSVTKTKVAPTQQQPNAQPAQDISKLKVKNPETGNDISVKAALTYDKTHPVYKAAQAIVAKNTK
jgi:hypothetical protein